MFSRSNSDKGFDQQYYEAIGLSQSESDARVKRNYPVPATGGSNGEEFSEQYRQQQGSQ